MTKYTINNKNLWSYIYYTIITIISFYPVYFLITIVNKYAVNIPFWDMWNWIYLIEKYYSGELNIFDFLIQHNEHRLFVPKLIFLPIALIGKWQTHHFSYISIFFSICIFILFLAGITMVVAQCIR